MGGGSRGLLHPASQIGFRAAVGLRGCAAHTADWLCLLLRAGGNLISVGAASQPAHIPHPTSLASLPPRMKGSWERGRPQNRYRRYFARKNNKTRNPRVEKAHISGKASTLTSLRHTSPSPVLQTGSHMSARGRKTCRVPGGEGGIARRDYGGRSGSPRRPRVHHGPPSVRPSVCPRLAAAMWPTWGARAVAKSPTAVVYPEKER